MYQHQQVRFIFIYSYQGCFNQTGEDLFAIQSHTHPKIKSIVAWYYFECCLGVNVFTADVIRRHRTSIKNQQIVY